MLKREVKLHDGLLIGSGKAITAMIREETLEDEMIALELGLSGVLLDRTITMRRIISIGSTQNPIPEILRKLTRADFDLIEMAQGALDVEIGVAAGLLKKDGGGGRDEPGASTPGDADAAAAAE